MAAEFSPEDLREWRKDPNGAPFWKAVNELFAAGITNLRRAAAKGDAVESARHASHVETLEEILGLTDLIIAESLDDGSPRVVVEKR